MWCLFKKFTSHVWGHEVVLPTGRYSKTTRLVIGALLSAIAFILQSAGVFTGIGYLLSMMSTLPIVLATLLSIRIGVMTYVITFCLLAMFQPSEIVIFLFTTGLLGLGMGIGLTYFKKSLWIIASAALFLTLGISTLLFGLKFAILGPSIPSQFNTFVMLGIYIFSFIYSWIWMKVSVSVFNVFHKVLS